MGNCLELHLHSLVPSVPLHYSLVFPTIPPMPTFAPAFQQTQALDFLGLPHFSSCRSLCLECPSYLLLVEESGASVITQIKDDFYALLSLGVLQIVFITV